MSRLLAHMATIAAACNFGGPRPEAGEKMGQQNNLEKGQAPEGYM